MHKLKRFRIGITCVSETKWFYNGVYEVDGITVLHPGHDLPRSGETLPCEGPFHLAGGGFNVAPLADDSFVSQFTDHVVQLVERDGVVLLMA